MLTELPDSIGKEAEDRLCIAMKVGMPQVWAEHTHPGAQ